MLEETVSRSGAVGPYYPASSISMKSRAGEPTQFAFSTTVVVHEFSCVSPIVRNRPTWPTVRVACRFPLASETTVDKIVCLVVHSYSAQNLLGRS